MIREEINPDYAIEDNGCDYCYDCAEAISPAVIEDLGSRIFSRLLVNGMLIPVKGTNYYRKITEEEMQAAKKAYLAAQEETTQEAQNDEKTVLN